MNAFKARLEDRFGPLPTETEELLGTLKLRWIAQLLGLEKVVLKSNKLIGTFVRRGQRLLPERHVARVWNT